MNEQQREILRGLIDHCKSELESVYDYGSRDDGDDEAIKLWKERITALEQALVDSSKKLCRTCHPELPFDLEFATDDVPWQRQGYPCSLTKDDRPWKKNFANASVCKNRLYTDAYCATHGGPTGLLERACAALWDYEHNGSYNGGILGKLMADEPLRFMIRDAADEHLCQLVGQAVAQWMGTNCGQGFIDTARRIAKCDEEKIREEVKFLAKLTDCPSGQNSV